MCKEGLYNARGEHIANSQLEYDQWQPISGQSLQLCICNECGKVVFGNTGGRCPDEEYKRSYFKMMAELYISHCALPAQARAQVTYSYTSLAKAAAAAVSLAKAKATAAAGGDPGPDETGSLVPHLDTSRAYSIGSNNLNATVGDQNASTSASIMLQLKQSAGLNSDLQSDSDSQRPRVGVTVSDSHFISELESIYQTAQAPSQAQAHSELGLQAEVDDVSKRQLELESDHDIMMDLGSSSDLDHDSANHTSSRTGSPELEWQLKLESDRDIDMDVNSESILDSNSESESPAQDSSSDSDSDSDSNLDRRHFLSDLILKWHRIVTTQTRTTHAGIPQAGKAASVSVSADFRLPLQPTAAEISLDYDIVRQIIDQHQYFEQFDDATHRSLLGGHQLMSLIFRNYNRYVKLFNKQIPIQSTATVTDSELPVEELRSESLAYFPEEILIDCKLICQIWDQYAERIINIRTVTPVVVSESEFAESTQLHQHESQPAVSNYLSLVSNDSKFESDSQLPMEQYDSDHEQELDQARAREPRSLEEHSDWQEEEEGEQEHSQEKEDSEDSEQEHWQNSKLNSDSESDSESDSDSGCYIDYYLKSRPDSNFQVISSSNYPYSSYHTEIRRDYLDFTARPLPSDAQTTIMERILSSAASVGPEIDFRIQARKNHQKALWDQITRLSTRNLKMKTYLVLRRECLMFLRSVCHLMPYSDHYRGNSLSKSELLTVNYVMSDYCTTTSFQIIMHEHLLWRTLEGHTRT